MATRLNEVDVVLVGLGWTGGILAKELSAAGLKVVALERGGLRSTESDFAVPAVRDELRYVVRHDLMMNTQKDTLTVRNHPSQEALPMRRLGSFLPGDVVGGSSIHWSGHTWRWTDMEFKVRSLYEERYGKNYIPADMTIQDWGITYAELEPYYDKFEYMAGGSGKAGNIRGQIQPGGNPFEAPRAREWVTKVVKDASGSRVTGVTYTNVLNGEEFEQPAAMVLLCAYAINNVHLMLLSGIGQPYDPVSQQGVIGKNYCYQTGAGANLFFEGRNFNPFISAGGTNATIDDFNLNWDFDRGPQGFVGGYTISSGFNSALPLGYPPVAHGTPSWGRGWEAATGEWDPNPMNHRSGRRVLGKC